jgi:VWFA-related protein
MACTDRFGLKAGLAMRRAAVWVCVALGWSGVTAAAQDNGVPTLHVYTNLVQVPALVLDQNRKPIVPIAEGRFFISLDGGPKFRVAHARLEGDEPISLAILLDVGQAFPVLMTKMDDAIAGLAPRSLHPQDRVSVYSMDCNLVRTSIDAPADAVLLKGAVDRALAEWSAGVQDRHKRDCQKPWNLRDSMALAANRLSTQPGRRVLLAVTDGVDRGSRTSWNVLRDYAQEHSVAIFGLLQPGDLSRLLPTEPRKLDSAFSALCEVTGGMVLTATPTELAERLKWFTTLLRERYILEFPRPLDTEGGKHEMIVTVDRMEALILTAGIGIPLPDPAISKDPTTVPMDPAAAPQLGKRKVLSPN